MSSSPYIPEDVKNYMKQFQLEKLMNKSINLLLKNRPDDPYSFLIGQFQKLAKDDIIIQKIKGYQFITAQGIPTIKIQVICLYLNKQIQFFIIQPLSILSDQNMIYDQDRYNGKGMKKGIAFMENKLAQQIYGLKCSQQLQIDKKILTEFNSNNNLGIYQLYSISYLPSLIQSHLLSKPLYQVYADMIDNKNQHKKVNIMINCLHGGKAIGSKCKVFKYYLIAYNLKDAWLLQTVLQAIRKTIVSGKGGQAALKISPDGTFICPLDTIIDNLKIVEDAIVSNNAKQIFSIGLSWQADTFYTPETKKYQLENPKTPFDNDQMIDYLVKLLIDKPIIQYLQDPLAPTQKASWKKLINKIKQTQAIKNVKIGSRNGKIFTLNDKLKQQINDISIPITQDSHPQSTQQTRKQSNINKYKLNYVQCRPYELKTLSNLLQYKKQLSKANTMLILQDNNIETYDTSLIDLCVGTDSIINLGSLNKYQRICKLNRISQILQKII